MDGLILIDKEQEWTSRDICNKMQSIFSTKKVGHTGTLDPFATGLLIVTINKANKVGQFMDDFKKTYVAALKLGKKTTTGDLTGDVIAEKDIPSLTNDEISSALHSFLGKSKQMPPMTSAIHVNGRKLYEYYYEGETVDRPLKDIEIYDIKLIDYKDDIITFECTVSTGTYIRVLGEDVAKKLNTLGHLISLRRTKIGDFDVKDATKIGDVTIDIKHLSSYDALSFMPTYFVDDEKIKWVKDGKLLKIDNIKENLILVASKDHEAIAVYEKISDNLYGSKRGLW